MNYGKYQFELNKKLQIAKKKQKQIQVKEIASEALNLKANRPKDTALLNNLNE